MSAMRSTHKKIAILGNGQLAMLLKSAQLPTDTFTLTAFDLTNIDINTLKNHDVMTVETENIPDTLLQSLNIQNKFAIQASQDRLLEKKLFQKLNIPTNHFYPVTRFEDLKPHTIIKTRKLGYDGKGQYRIQSQADIEDKNCPIKLGAATEITFDTNTYIAESLVNFEEEVSQVASRDQFGTIVYYPLTLNQHENGILRTSQPIQNHPLTDLARQYTRTLLEHFDYIGTFAIEFFVMNDQLLANEMAPRVHNSGHWTSNATSCSQFRNHLLAISGQPVQHPVLTMQYSMMINIIGEYPPQSISAQHIDVHIDIYNYQKSLRPNRKMGHINITSNKQDPFQQITRSLTHDANTHLENTRNH